ncbi:MAG: ABC transporter ATP-binding protein [Planctomycetaceae bacterium]|nr:ABC transporter ATP-binding protein [Planctomycetaceae bacterium]
MAETNEHNVIEVISLTKIFADWWGRSRVIAVNDVNLTVKNNQVFGLLGPNGSGKTTMIKMLLGLLHPTKGRTFVLGGDSKDPRINSQIGFLPEESYLYPYLNARETLDFYGRLFGLNSRVRKARIEVLLEMVGLSGMASRPVGTFSKGMARRIGLAQALINDPKLLILDEPTSGLDPIGTRQIKDLIIELARRGKTILLSSHLLADAEEVCDRVAILYGGIVQKEGSIEELLEEKDKTQITTSVLTDRTIEQIRIMVEKEGGEIEIKPPMQKLESYFINIVSQAQKAKKYTSGAVNRLEMSDAQRAAAMSDVLDKLVAAKVESQKLEKVESPVVVEGEKTTDLNVINQLAQGPSVQMPERLESAKNSENVNVQDEIKKNILDELTKRQENDNE